MTIEEFHEKRKMFIMDPDTGIVKFPMGKYANLSHAKWFSEVGYPFIAAIRGYYWNENGEEFVIIYQDNFEIPRISLITLPYLFEYFPTVKWIGLGCHIDEPGKIWEPQIKCFRQ